MKTPCVIWLFGLSGSGKTTISTALTEHLSQKGVSVKQLDGDDLRKGINNNLGFSLSDRLENIRRSAEVAKLFVESEFITICSFITPTEATRNAMREVLKEKNLIEVYVKASINTCRQRDPKGFYKRVDNGEIKDFTGIDSLFEIPTKTDIIADTDELNVEEAVELILKSISKSN